MKLCATQPPLSISMNPYTQSFEYKGKTISFQFMANLARHVYLAQLIHPTKIKYKIVKFTKSYSVDAHNFFCSLKLAPKLYCCNKISKFSG
jgi:hypothetical protein